MSQFQYSEFQAVVLCGTEYLDKLILSNRGNPNLQKWFEEVSKLVLLFLYFAHFRCFPTCPARRPKCVQVHCPVCCGPSAMSVLPSSSSSGLQSKTTACWLSTASQICSGGLSRRSASSWLNPIAVRQFMLY